MADHGFSDMNFKNLRGRIADALRQVRGNGFLVGARDLLGVIGYESERAIDLSGSVHDFLDQFRAPNENTQTEQAFRENVQFIRLFFQVTGEEIGGGGGEREL